MKKRNAFAFRNFDEQRILSRPYFKKFRDDYHVEDGLSDEEILATLSADEADSVDDMEQKLQTVREGYEHLGNFRKFIARHNENRLDPYNKRKAAAEGLKVSELSKLQRPAPVLDYMIAIFRCSDLMEKFHDLYYELEEKIQLRYRTEFAARLKKLRKASGMTQQQLGYLVQISPQGFSMYESGKREPSIATLSRLAKIFTPEKLFS